MKQIEDVWHFMGRSPILNEFRIRFLEKVAFTEEEIKLILNEYNRNLWENRIMYSKSAFQFRNNERVRIF